MGMIESFLWIMTGFISTLVTMEVVWGVVQRSRSIGNGKFLMKLSTVVCLLSLNRNSLTCISLSELYIFRISCGVFKPIEIVKTEYRTETLSH